MKTVLLMTLCEIIAFTAFSCQKESFVQCTCGVENPLENIVWLKDLVTDLTTDTEVDSATITTYDYSDSNAFYVYIHKKMLYDSPNPIFNCEGEMIFRVGGNQLNDSSAIFFDSAANPQLIWSK